MNKKKNTFYLLLFSIFLITSSVYSQKLELEYELLFEMTGLLDKPIEIGESSIGKRTIYPVTSGTFNGPELKGKILPNGGDWLLMIDATTAKIDVRIVLETDDGEKIYTHYDGFIHWYDDGSYYFRTNPVFETASSKYSWLNYMIAVGVGELVDGGVKFKVYAIK